MARVILSFNLGSSSCKCSLYSISAGSEHKIAEAAIENIGAPDGRIWIRDAERNSVLDSKRQFARPHDAVLAMLEALDRAKLPAPDAVGHRIVHGGMNHVAPELVTPKLISDLKALIPFAPLHMPGGIEAIEAISSRLPKIPQVTCFDTAFHRTMPEIAQRFALPRALSDAGIRRYGFHGISYEYIMSTLGVNAPRRVIIAHLGNGASMAAVLDGRGFDTTMGFTPAGGFMMSMRSGDLDPGVLLYLLEQKGYDVARLDSLVNRESGLLGVSDLSSDVKTLLDYRPHDRNAAEAIAMFCYQLRKTIGALRAAMDGLDLLVFTGGIGEHSPIIRAEVCAGLTHVGIVLDGTANLTNSAVVSATLSLTEVRVIPTDENLMIARHVIRLLFPS